MGDLQRHGNDAGWPRWSEEHSLGDAAGLDMMREHRTVVLPPFQGMGIGSLLADTVAHLCSQLRYAFVSMTVHPQYGSYRDRSPFWVALPSKEKEGKNKMFSHIWIGARGDPQLQARLARRITLENPL